MAARERCCCDREHVTPREVDVIALIATGYSNGRIARLLGLSRHTVASHVTTAMQRVGAANRAELVARCYVTNLLTGGVWPPAPSGRRCIGA